MVQIRYPILIGAEKVLLGDMAFYCVKEKGLYPNNTLKLPCGLGAIQKVYHRPRERGPSKSLLLFGWLTRGGQGNR